MKNLMSILILLLSTILLTSCTDNDDTLKLGGKMVVNGVEHPLTKAFIIPNYTGDDPSFDKRRFSLFLTNGDIAMQNNAYLYSDSITQLIELSLYTSTEKSGSVEYTTYKVYNSHSDTDFNDAFISHSGIHTNVLFRNWEFVSANSLSSDDMTSGQVTISLSNGIYSINFSFSNPDNTITGTYKGHLTELNYQY